jgi:hypothetical protein
MTDKKALRGASKTAPIEISANDLAEIDDILADVTYAGIAAKYRRKLTAKAHGRAVWHRRREEAFERAVEVHHPDPASYAFSAASAAGEIDFAERRVRSIFKKVDAGNRKRSEKLALKHERLSKTAKTNSRRFPASDRQYVEILGNAERKGYLAHSTLVAQDIKKKLKAYRLPHWDKTTPALKVMAMSVHCHKAVSRTINLHINKDICVKALASPRGPASFMQDAIRRSFVKTFGRDNTPDFLIVVETTAKDRYRANDDGLASFHVHGLVVLPDHPRAAEVVDDALRVAGGEWTASGGHQRQHLGVPLTDPYVWAAYMLKDVLGTQRHIDRKLFARSEGLLSAARSSWDDLRKSLPQIA